MNISAFKRFLGLALALVLTVSAVPVTALASEVPEEEFTLIELKATDVTLDETVFTYTGSEIKPNVTVRVEDRLLTLDKDYTLSYADNIEVGTGKVIVTGIATAAPSYGFTGTVEIPFSINAKEPEFTLVEIQSTDVTIEGTEFTYTGQPIEPAVTVTVGGQTLENGKDYAVEYINNLVPGTGTVIVRGIATASETLGYTGEVRIDFTISPKAEDEQSPIEITQDNVTINGKSFTYTGEAIEPEITVTVDGKVLTAGQDYNLRYVNNVEPGTGSAIITGIATEEGGYTGEVQVKFTIVPMTEENYPLVEIKGTDVTIEGTKFDYTGKAIEPKITVTVDGKVLTAGKDYSLKYVNNVEVGTATAIVTGIATATETGGYTGEVKINFSIVEVPAAPSYKITKGSGATWYQNSGKALSFTADGPFADFIGLSVNGKTVDSSYYSVKEGSTVVLLKNELLKQLKTGTYTITLHFEDGAKAEGTFKVAAEDENPKTGDPIFLWVTVLFLSLMGMTATALVSRKKLWK